jgi:hypothetical protein
VGEPATGDAARVRLPIFSFHVFGTAGSRMLAERFVIDNRLIQLALGIACGLLLPIAVDLIFQRDVILRRVFLERR